MAERGRDGALRFPRRVQRRLNGVNSPFRKPFSRSSRRNSAQILSEKQGRSEPTHVGCYCFNSLVADSPEGS